MTGKRDMGRGAENRERKTATELRWTVDVAEPQQSTSSHAARDRVAVAFPKWQGSCAGTARQFGSTSIQVSG